MPIWVPIERRLTRMPASVFRGAVHAHSRRGTLANRVNEFTTLDGRYRLYAELLRLSRPDPVKPSRAIVSPPPLQAELAARISIRREAVGKELKALERAKLIERRRGALVLTDTARLRRSIEKASELV